MDFEYHGALRHIAVEQMPVPYASTHEMQQWDALMHDFVDLSELETNTEDQMQLSGPTDPSAGSDVVPKGTMTPQHMLIDSSASVHPTTTPLQIGDSDYSPSSVSNASSSTTEDLQRQIDQLKDMVAQLASRPRHKRQYSTDIERKQSLESVRADSVLSRAGGANMSRTPGHPSGDAIALAATDDASETQPFPDDSPIYSRRGSASTISSIPSRRGQRVPGGYPCGRCDLAFDIPSQLKHHERKHLAKNDRPFPCSQCDERFLYPKDLGRHKERIHGITISDIKKDGSSAQLPSNRATLQGSMDHYYSQHNWQARLSTVRQHEGHFEHSAVPNSTGKRKRATSSAVQATAHLTTTGDIRNSTIPETEAVHMRTASHVDIVRGLQIQIDLQQDTIDDLERKLAKAEEDAEAWLEERNTFAKVLQRMPGSITARPAMYFEQKNKRMPSLAERAKGWLGAIDKLLSTKKRDHNDAQTSNALEHIAEALDELRLRD